MTLGRTETATYETVKRQQTSPNVLFCLPIKNGFERQVRPNNLRITGQPTAVAGGKPPPPFNGTGP